MTARAIIHQNLMIASLRDDERFRVVRAMEPVELPARTELLRGGAPAEAVYFPTSGLVSFVSMMANGYGVECAALGVEGWVGAELFGGAIPAGTTVVQQIAGSALRLPASAFASVLAEAPALAQSIARFSGVMLTLAMQNAACNRLHDALERCARWLLLTHDRLGRDELALTHDFLAQMLGGNRSSVTATLTRLENEGLIERSRATIVVRNADGLRGVACECYGVVRDAYSRYLCGLGLSSAAAP